MPATTMEELGLPETPMPGAASVEAGVAGTILEHRLEAADGAEAVLGGKDVLPSSVGDRVEDLFKILLESAHASDQAGGRWTKTNEDKRNLVELAGLLYEYCNEIPQLQGRMGARIAANSIRKLLPDFPSLTAVELHVLNSLQDAIRTNMRTSRFYTESEKKYIIACVRLMRKRYLCTQEYKSFLNDCGIKVSNLFLWVSKIAMESERGMMVTTRELVPEFYAAAEAECSTEQGSHGAALPSIADGTLLTADTVKEIPHVESDDPLGTVASDQESGFPEASSNDGRDTIHSNPLVTDRTQAIVARIVDQNNRIIQILEQCDPRDPKVDACNTLLVGNRALIQVLLGNQESPDTISSAAMRAPEHAHGAVTLAAGTITIPPDVIAAVQAEQMQVTIIVRDFPGGERNTEIQMRR